MKRKAGDRVKGKYNCPRCNQDTDEIVYHGKYGWHLWMCRRCHDLAKRTSERRN